MLRKILPIYILLLNFSVVFCQNTGKTAAVLLTDRSLYVTGETAERAVLLTDRSLYVTGETILFSAQLFHSGESFQESMVLYAELVTPAGEQVAGFKYKVYDSHCSGSLVIPAIIPSGNYYLRAYTKLMRNFNPECYGYCPIKIVNPGKKEVLAGNGVVKDELQTDLVPSKDPGGHFQIELDADTFGARESITARLTALLPQGDALLHAVISVIPYQSCSQSELQFPVSKEEPGLEKVFPAETDGLTISGTVRFNEKRETNDPAPVNLTLLGAHANLFYPVLTDRNDRFVFTMPDLHGQHDLFISTGNNATASELLVDYDFDGRTVNLPSPVFVLTPEERETVLKMASNEKVRQYFSDKAAVPDSRDAHVLNDTIPFYGKPDHMVYLSDFIDLPYLSDYFTELPLPLRIRNQKDLKSITITGGDAGLSIFPPLLMVDYIPVYDPGEILNINPDKVFRFDIVASTYIRGRRTYGGILNVITRKNDFAGITLPSSGLFLNYQFLEPEKDSALAREVFPGHFPDARNTLYWNPSMKLDNSGTGSFTFRTSDSNGSYIIRVTGITRQGVTFTSSTQFRVGN